MLMVVFGAGASYDSVHPTIGRTRERGEFEHFQPPLANEIVDLRTNFGEAMGRFPECSALALQLRKALKAGRQLEEELERLQRESREYPPLLRQLAAFRFYLQLTMWGCSLEWPKRANGATNYVALLNRIDRWRHARSEKVVLVTFNYDTMIEQAMERTIGIQMRQMDDYLASPDYKLCKLHGSVNWGRLCTTYVAARDPHTVQVELIRRAAELTFGDVFEILANPNRLITSNLSMTGYDRQALFPAIGIPVEEETSFECPDAQVQTVTSAIPDVTRLLIIGWRGTERRFLDLWRGGVNSDLAIQVVAGSPEGGSRPAAETIQNLTLVGIKGREIEANVGFSEFVEGDLLDELLES